MAQLQDVVNTLNDAYDVFSSIFCFTYEILNSVQSYTTASIELSLMAWNNFEIGIEVIIRIWLTFIKRF